VSRIVVDYEELRRMSSVWAEASLTLGRLATRVAELTMSPEIVTNALFDPAGAARCEAAILSAALGPHGLAVLAAKLAGDAALLRVVVMKEQLVDDLPLRQLGALDASLLMLPLTASRDPSRAASATAQRAITLADAAVGYGAPFSTPLLELLAPSSRFRLDVAARRPVSVDPVFGVPLAAVVPSGERSGGSVSISRYSPAWGGQPPTSISSVLSEIGDLETRPEASIAVQRVVGHDGVARYVVVLSGMRHLASTPDPERSHRSGRRHGRCSDELHDVRAGSARYSARPSWRPGGVGRAQPGWHRRDGSRRRCRVQRRKGPGFAGRRGRLPDQCQIRVAG
jgi:hypothetical protein